MFRILCLSLLVLFTSVSTPTASESHLNQVNIKVYASEFAWKAEQLYQDFGLELLLPMKAFEQALEGYYSIDHPKTNILSIVDFSKPSTEKRMFILDMDNLQVLYHTFVAHGRGSGGNIATSFSNAHGSFQSSLGFFRTAQTYQGGNGYSLIIDGLEKGINDQARARAVVIHGADYSNEDFVARHGRLGRSHGCPALPRELNQEIIDTIKGGSLLYIYADNADYELSSILLNDSNSWAE